MGCHIECSEFAALNTVLNVHAPSEEISDDSRDNFYEELEHFCEYFPKCHMNNSVRKI
jgi:hypothetical protein